ncbi:YciK family oxidoreductase [Endozoicomonas sp. SCSIO W0465]|uniref:YciK family oxidoreductase n=1 Tax=Endozoicomonas sp. SCSIO W0465 TaxID=2918516 RepID=UPI002074D33E|nr:YciK family oxidoreductase [Endozoicomonas sp. SCSIO W0465]USE39093.1 YciK family oxidoreductase [Endozoicomonas sp. SCSIO W0465]
MFTYQAPKNLLKDKVILVTGAGRGIGRVAALTYARHGATVILLGRSTETLEAVYDEIELNQWPQPAIYPLNLESAGDIDFCHLAETIETEFGRLDGLLHNASLLGELQPISQFPTETWKRIMQVNLNSAFMMTRELLPLLRLSEKASVIFTSSGVGHRGRAHWGAYSVSKFATEGLMQVLADEEDGISAVRANSIDPGGTRTSMRASAFPGEDPEKLPTPEDIMPVYLYLMGDDSQNINGQAFHAQQS